jgi:hypothetical protein
LYAAIFVVGGIYVVRKDLRLTSPYLICSILIVVIAAHDYMLVEKLVLAKGQTDKVSSEYQEIHHVGNPALYQKTESENQVRIFTRLREFIKGSLGRYRIVYNDVLGEGDGHFDSDLRYNDVEMNCTTWLKAVLAKTYSASPEDFQNVHDAVSYYHNRIGFSTRMHYTDGWLYVNPGPLQQMDLNFCGDVLNKSVQLNYEKFKKSHGYSCPLYREDMDRFDILYVNHQDTLSCAEKLNEGVYFIFPLAADKYIAAFGQKSGMMGLVHGLILNIDKDDGNLAPIVYHASTSDKHVVRLPLAEYLQSKGASRHAGYTLWQLDPNWLPQDYPLSESEEQNINDLLKCEQNLVSKRKNKIPRPPFPKPSSQDTPADNHL